MRTPTRFRFRARWVLACALAIACEPKLTSDDWRITSARVIAVRGDPPETKPGVPATFTAFIAVPEAEPGGDGGHDAPSFGFCTAPKPPGENAVVSSECLGHSALVPLGAGDSVTATLPVTACTQFGPIAAPGGFRPRDPDATGGYYQPLRVDLDAADPVFHLARISCGVENASSDVASEFAAKYTANQNPHILSLSATIDGKEASPDAVPRGARVELSLRWTAADAETYAYFDPGALKLTSAREAMRVAWYATNGQLETEATGREADDLAVTSDNVWAAPTQSGPSHLWVVLRDARGGVDVVAREMHVR